MLLNMSRWHEFALRSTEFEWGSRSWPGGAMSRAIVALGVLSALGCGSRTQLRGGEPQCELDVDCDQSSPCLPQSCIEGQCFAAPLDCGPNPPCQQIACNPSSGQCETIDLTLDLDGDGFKGPLPGYAAGQEGSCGDDCDDTSPAAYPGGVEICDGVDNDCDLVIDNDALFLADAELPDIRQLDSAAETSSRRGFSYGDGIFAAGYWGAKGGSRSSWISGINERTLDDLWQKEAVLVNVESYGADLVWSGDSFGSTWSDIRYDSNYEVFFNRFNKYGDKLGPDLRITTAPNFSTDSIVEFDQGRYILVWADQRAEVSGIGTQVFTQIVDFQGRLVGGNRVISRDGEFAEGPVLAATPTRFGLAYTDSPMLGEPDEGNIRLHFRTFDKEFGGGTFIRLAEDDVREPRVIAAGENFVVSWSVQDELPGPSIMGAVLNSNGELLVGPEPITFGGTLARSSSLLSFGDRFMLLWSDNLHGNLELYAQVMDLEFNVLEARVRLTDDPGITGNPIATRGETGTIGILFDDDRSGRKQAYFTALQCTVRTLR